MMWRENKTRAHSSYNEILRVCFCVCYCCWWTVLLIRRSVLCVVALSYWAKCSLLAVLVARSICRCRQRHSKRIENERERDRMSNRETELEREISGCERMEKQVMGTSHQRYWITKRESEREEKSEVLCIRRHFYFGCCIFVSCDTHSIRRRWRQRRPTMTMTATATTNIYIYTTTESAHTTNTVCTLLRHNTIRITVSRYGDCIGLYTFMPFLCSLCAPFLFFSFFLSLFLILFIVCVTCQMLCMLNSSMRVFLFLWYVFNDDVRWRKTEYIYSHSLIHTQAITQSYTIYMHTQCRQKGIRMKWKTRTW